VPQAPRSPMRGHIWHLEGADPHAYQFACCMTAALLVAVITLMLVLARFSPQARARRAITRAGPVTRIADIEIGALVKLVGRVRLAGAALAGPATRGGRCLRQDSARCDSHSPC